MHVTEELFIENDVDGDMIISEYDGINELEFKEL